VLVNLLTGATTPRTGEVRAFGRLTTEIPDSDSWLVALRQYGLLGVRTVLIEQLTVEQNLAIPLTLDVDRCRRRSRRRCAQLGAEVGLGAGVLDRRPPELGPLDLQRVRLGAALALARRCCWPNIRRRRSNAATPSSLRVICRALFRRVQWRRCTSPPTARLRSKPLTKL
jgi:predicted ABC-type transport system involved in lysophospholipase L1 biosynthesis ATPase subunit